MDVYVTSAAIRQLREKRGLTQAMLAEQLGVSPKAVSKWETARGLPDISLIEPLSKALGVSVLELMKGEPIVNRNACANLLRAKWYVCPICGNVLWATGDAVVSCCGVTLCALEAEEPDEAHALTVEPVENEWFVSLPHDMTKGHFVSFLACVTPDRVQLVKLYPEGPAQARFARCGRGQLFAYCNRHGLFRQKV